MSGTNTKVKGKNFSTNNVTGRRKKSDLYETPYSITRQFFETGGAPLLKSKTISLLEPARGNGAIEKVLDSLGFLNVTAYDIAEGYDFLEEDRFFPVIITNPPFSLAFEFIQKAKTVANEFHFLLPLSYLHGKRRFDEVYSDQAFPLVSVGVFTRYPMMGEELRDDGKYHTGMMVYGWFSWVRSMAGKEVVSPRIYWIDNQSYVIKRGD